MYCLWNSRIEVAADIDGPRRVHHHVVDLRCEARFFDLDFVRSNGERQALEHAVEVVDDARVVAVDEDLRTTWSHLESHIAIIDRNAVHGCRHIPIDAAVIRSAVPISRAEPEEHVE